jgi:flagellar basal-body rod protein FlgB
MVSVLDGITTKIVGYALDGLSSRHQAIASNIANSGAYGYRPVQVDFESQLAKVAEQLNSSAITPSSDISFEPQISLGSPISTDTSSTMLERNVVMLNQNTLQYQALVKGLATYASTIAEAIKEGKR